MAKLRDRTFPVTAGDNHQGSAVVSLRRYALAGLRKAGLFASALGLFIIGSVTLVTAGCGGDGGDDFASNGPSRATLTGIWNKSGLAIPGREVSCPNTLTTNNVTVDACVNGERIEFKSDGSYVATYPAPRFLRLTTEEGTYSVDGDTLTLTRTRIGFDRNTDGLVNPAREVQPVNPTQRVVYDIDISGNTMTLAAVQQPLTKSDGTTFTNSDGSINTAILNVDGTLPSDAENAGDTDDDTDDDNTDDEGVAPRLTLSAATVTFEKQLL